MKMKKCPKCGMLTAESGECPICHTTVTYEPIIYADKEKYAFNKYYARYQLKNCLFSILLLLAVTVRVIIAPPFLSAGIAAYALVLISFLCSFFYRRLTRYVQFMYSPEFSEWHITRMRIFTAIAGLVLSFFKKF